MKDIRIIVAGLWIATMLVYLLGDVLRIFSGDATPGKLFDNSAGPGTWFLIAVIMLIPILMLVFTLILPHPYIRTLNLVMVVIVFIFNIIGLPYKGLYDNFLIVVSLIFNGMVFYYSWIWR